MKSDERKTRALVLARSGGLCERCGVFGYTVHHRMKRSQAGPWSGSNCVALCGDGVRGCHGFVEANPNAAWEEGWHVRPWEKPGERLIRKSIHGVVLLDDEGGIALRRWPDGA